MRQVSVCFFVLAASFPVMACHASVGSASDPATDGGDPHGSRASGSGIAPDGDTPPAACDTPAGQNTAILEGLYAYDIAVDDQYVYAATPPSSRGSMPV